MQTEVKRLQSDRIQSLQTSYVRDIIYGQSSWSLSPVPRLKDISANSVQSQDYISNQTNRLWSLYRSMKLINAAAQAKLFLQQSQSTVCNSLDYHIQWKPCWNHRIMYTYAHSRRTVYRLFIQVTNTEELTHPRMWENSRHEICFILTKLASPEKSLDYPGQWQQSQDSISHCYHITTTKSSRSVSLRQAFYTTTGNKHHRNTACEGNCKSHILQPNTKCQDT